MSYVTILRNLETLQSLETRPLLFLKRTAHASPPRLYQRSTTPPRDDRVTGPSQRRRETLSTPTTSPRSRPAPLRGAAAQPTRYKCGARSSFSRQRPYHAGSTGSLPHTEVKQRWVRLVLRWVTAWEHRMPLASLLPADRQTDGRTDRQTDRHRQRGTRRKTFCTHPAGIEPARPLAGPATQLALTGKTQTERERDR